MVVIVGLGNPGPAYRVSRHNAGAMIVRALATSWGIRLGRRVGSATVGEGAVGPHPVVVSIPRTFMNGSGQAVADLVAQWPVPRAQLLVICDDAALPFGTLRIRPQGSDGGHRGLRSITEALGETGFPRLRVGIAAVQTPKALDQFVLAPFSPGERRQWPQIVDQAVAACTLWVQEGMAAAMNRYNRKVRGA